MRICFIPDGRVYAGKPIDVVTRMREYCLRPTSSLEEFINGVCERAKILNHHLSYCGKNDDERCFSFLESVAKEGLLEVEFTVPQNLDRFAIILLRKPLGLSQEKMAKKLKVYRGSEHPHEAQQPQALPASARGKEGR